jgi:hypothetical protein
LISDVIESHVTLGNAQQRATFAKQGTPRDGDADPTISIVNHSARDGNTGLSEKPKQVSGFLTNNRVLQLKVVQSNIGT